jgi:hypothetical protein
MTAAAVRSHPLPDPPTSPAGSRATAYEQVLHRLVRRELHVLARLSTWAAPDDVARTAALTAHADLLGRVLLHHHAVERELLWPALLRALPPADVERGRERVATWTDRCARLDSLLRDISTAARQWAVAGSGPARDAFAMACLVLAGAVDAQTAEEEREVLPLLAALPAAEWTAITASAGCPLSGSEQLLVLGLALEDACPDERARILAALSPATRLAWRLGGERHHRAAVIRLRGEPPSA